MTSVAAAGPQVHWATESALDDDDLLGQGIQEVLPAALVTASPQARDLIGSGSYVGATSADHDDLTSVLAAALGAAAVPAMTSLLRSWLERRKAKLHSSALPAWLRPALRSNMAPLVTPLTEFSQRRTQFVKEVEEGQVIVLTRRGSAVAAIVPLEAGAYESAVTVPALQRLLDEADHGGMTDPAVLEEIRTSSDPLSTAAGLGIDVSGWGHLNPPDAAADIPEQVRYES